MMSFVFVLCKLSLEKTDRNLIHELNGEKSFCILWNNQCGIFWASLNLFLKKPKFLIKLEKI